MPLNIKNKRSAVQGSAPAPAQLEDGEIGVNYNALDPAIYLKDSAGAVVRIAGSGAIGGPTVFSVNGEIGDVVLDADDVGALKTGDDVSELNNDAGYITAGDIPAAPVDSVNSQTGTVVLVASDVGAATAAQGLLADSATQPGDNVSTLTNDAGYLTSAPAAPVDSVNGQTGIVVLGAADVGAATAAQGTRADSAVQPGDLATVATSGDYDDLTNKPAPGLTDTSTAVNSVGVGSASFNSDINNTESVAVGYRALLTSTAAGRNTAVGSEALEAYSSTNANARNTAVAYSSLNSLTSGTTNTAVGGLSLFSLTTGQSNTAVGDSAGYSYTGSQSTFIGYQAGFTSAISNTNITVIGYGASPSSTTVSNEITIGNAFITKFRIPGINFTLKDNGSTPTEGQVLTVDSSGEGYWKEPAVNSDPTGVTGADSITNMMSLTQAQYDNISTPDASTLYVITP